MGDAEPHSDEFLNNMGISCTGTSQPTQVTNPTQPQSVHPTKNIPISSTRTTSTTNHDFGTSSSDFDIAVACAIDQLSLPYKLKDEQVAVLQHLWNGHDVIGLLPTGYGKSLIYQVAPFVLQHRSTFTGDNPICIVVSPLNSIMQDQMLKLGKMGIAACSLDMVVENVTTAKEGDESDDEESDDDDDDYDDGVSSTNRKKKKFVLSSGSWDSVLKGKYNVVYAHPEALISSPKGKALMQSSVYKKNVCCIAVDEAHLVEAWKKFRKDFTKLSQLIAKFDDIPHLVLTATASPSTVVSIKEKLQLRDCKMVEANPDRPNISYWKYTRTTATKEGLEPILDVLIKELTEKKEAFPLTILYSDLLEIGHAYKWFKTWLPDDVAYDGPVCPENRRFAQFHADYDDEMKQLIIQELIKKFPKLVIVFATTALGMGLDAKSVRRVIHFKAPKNIERYLQETGRAGRDGKPAKAWLFYNGTDTLKDATTGESSTMKGYCQSKDKCLRIQLLDHLKAKPTKRQAGWTCCAVCHKKSKK